MDDAQMDQMSMMQQGMGDAGPLFWSLRVEADKTVDIDQPAIPNYIVHITNACFGPEVKKNSRSVVMVTTSSEEETDAVPLCVLKEGQIENQSLDLLFNESATMTVQGNKPSTVYLTGYLQPPIMPDMMNPDMEDMDEEMIMRQLAAQREQATEDAKDSSEEEEEVEEPPTKKQRTTKGQKATANGAKKEEPKRKGQSEEEVKPKKNKKKGKQAVNKNGIKFKQLKEGTGTPAKKGDKVRVYYVGQTEDKEVFDKAITGSGFEFTLGKGEVIQGWDIGVLGMKVGGKARMTIPSKLAYGEEGSPPQIPSNATLQFTVEIKGIN